MSSGKNFLSRASLPRSFFSRVAFPSLGAGGALLKCAVAALLFGVAFAPVAAVLPVASATPAPARFGASKGRPRLTKQEIARYAELPEATPAEVAAHALTGTVWTWGTNGHTEFHESGLCEHKAAHCTASTKIRIVDAKSVWERDSLWTIKGKTTLEQVWFDGKDSFGERQWRFKERKPLSKEAQALAKTAPKPPAPSAVKNAAGNAKAASAAGASGKSKSTSSSASAGNTSATAGSVVFVAGTKAVAFDKVFVVPKTEVAAIAKLVSAARSKVDSYRSAVRSVDSARERAARPSGGRAGASNSNRKTPLDTAEERLEKNGAPFTEAKDKLLAEVEEKGKAVAGDEGKWTLDEKPEAGAYVFYTWTQEKTKTSGGVTVKTVLNGFAFESIGSGKSKTLRADSSATTWSAPAEVTAAGR
jgi:hypothetical protein